MISRAAPRAILLAVAAVTLAGCHFANAPAATGTSSPASPASSPPASSLAASTPAGAGFPVTLSAADGRLTIKSRPVRIVSLSASLTEDLYAVGAGPQVVAVDQGSDYPAGVPVTNLSGRTPNIEAIAKYSPDLVISYQDVNGLVSGLAKRGIPVLIEPPAATLNDAYAEIDQIGQATGHYAQAEHTVASMKSQIAATVRQAGSSHPGLSYYWELTANPYYSVTSSTFIGQIVGLFGLKNIADAANQASDGGYPQLSPQYIIAARPKIIFLTDNQAADGDQTPAAVAARPGWSAIPAVKDHLVIALNDDIASRWGPRLPQLVAEIAQAVERASG
jgi:iron complex transport system substrate-binding protein